ncbi:MAG: hypothetical protein LBQ81_00130 [Zoogloeaceae bacterium]|nr:hypothetical protein [Zoogloeaceae bacterium]
MSKGLYFILFCCMARVFVAAVSVKKTLRSPGRRNGISPAILKLLLVCTGVYLLCELSFNARLLDVVGGSASSDEIHHIEHYGRLLSGTAAGLFLWQFLLMLRHKKRNFTDSDNEEDVKSVYIPSFPGIVFALVVCVFGVYHGLEKLVDTLVESSSPAFRRQAINLSLIQRALVNDKVILSGMDETPGLYNKPEGKAFLALFPLIAISVEDLDEKIEHAKKDLLRDAFVEKTGGVQGYYDNAYVKAIQGATAQWKEYRGLEVGPFLNARIQPETDRVHNKSWREYKEMDSKCYRNGRKSIFTPNCLRKVDGHVREYLHDPKWQHDDEAGFRAGIEKQVRAEVIEEVRKNGIEVNGRKVPPGLSQAQFIAHPAVQSDLREKLNLPQTTKIPLSIDRQGFIRQLYEPMLAALTAKALANYNAPAMDYADGAPLAEQGRDAARSVLVPPVALFFSLLGAIGHLAKLTYLSSKLAFRKRIDQLTTEYEKRLVSEHVDEKEIRQRAEQYHGRIAYCLLLIPLVLIVTIWAAFSQMNNPVTRSRLYAALQQQALHHADAKGGTLRARILLNGIHVVAIGQSFAYPFNEGLRMYVLQGVNFGYVPAEKEQK